MWPTIFQYIFPCIYTCTPIMVAAALPHPPARFICLLSQAAGSGCARRAQRNGKKHRDPTGVTCGFRTANLFENALYYFFIAPLRAI
jgi:hypothetical protein